MRFLIDEDVPASVGAFLRERHHEVLFVAELFGKSTQDPIIVAGGDMIEAIVITHNRKDFDALVKKVPEGGRRHFRRLGLICLTCKQTRARQRVEECINLLEFQYQEIQRRGRGRLLADISDTGIRFTDHLSGT
jgi:predicted nuclease of predicted toxin-antitoxin system